MTSAGRIQAVREKTEDAQMIRFLLVAALVVACPLSSRAGELEPRSLTGPAIITASWAPRGPAAAAAAPFAGDVNWSLAPRPVGGDASQGSVLPSLYVSLAALNALDAYTTTKGIAGGAGVEANPLMRGVAGHPAALWAVKGGATAATVLLSERLRKSHHRAAALATMIVSNSVVAMISVRNARMTGGR
jgi:hypothetical protein